MPTGYTHDVPQGISFRTFAMNCARAFGACIMLRDEAGGGEAIPERFEPSSYHKDRADAARAELENLAAMTDEACLLAHVAEWDEGERYRLARLEENGKTVAAYKAMLAQVKAWPAPTGFAEFKKFMIDQLVGSIEFDDMSKHYANPAPKMSGAEWREKREEVLQRDVAYHEREHAKEVARTNERNAWIQTLRASLQEE